MWIRTQDKMATINLDNMIELYAQIVNPKKEIRETYTTDIKYHSEKLANRWLGTYSSKEKALKVLDMIEDAYFRANQGYYIHNVVFHMPADSEVNV